MMNTQTIPDLRTLQQAVSDAKAEATGGLSPEDAARVERAIDALAQHVRNTRPVSVTIEKQHEPSWAQEITEYIMRKPEAIRLEICHDDGRTFNMQVVPTQITFSDEAA